jgi:hypothetical protein
MGNIFGTTVQPQVQAPSSPPLQPSSVYYGPNATPPRPANPVPPPSPLALPPQNLKRNARNARNMSVASRMPNNVAVQPLPPTGESMTGGKRRRNRKSGTKKKTRRNRK